MSTLRGVVGEYGLYEKDVSIIKKIGFNIKVCNLSAVRKKGLVVDNKRNKESQKSTEKMKEALIRAKTALKEYALCNEWDYFCTFTIDKQKYDRYNLKAYYKDFSRFLLNYNRFCTENEKVKYLFVPEQHKDGAWHMHGLLKGIKSSDIYINEHGYIGWAKYEEKFGYISFGNIRDIEKTANYAMKYITKDNQKNVQELGAHLYYCSKGLKRGEVLFRGIARLKNCTWDYETDDGFCRLKWFKENDDIASFIDVMV